jgi:hypothetical protein
MTFLTKITAALQALFATSGQEGSCASILQAGETIDFILYG